MAPSRSFPSRVRHVAPRSPVSATNTGAATRDLEARTNYLNDVLQGIVGREALVHEAQTIDSDLLECQAVYWNGADQGYAPAAIGITVTSTATSLAESAECLGLLLIKTDVAIGTVIIAGLAWFTAAQLANAIDGVVLPGRYYLSPTPGKLVKARPAAAIPVAHVLGSPTGCDDGAWVIVNPQFYDFPDAHVHYQFALTARPAGTHVPSLVGGDHVITDPDVLLPGWLPAYHASFNGLAPQGAKFGYNLAAHPALYAAWPPLPPSAAVLELVAEDGPEQIPTAGRVTSEYIVFDTNGIWWMADCYGHVPWPADLDTTVAVSSSSMSASAESEAISCPTRAMQLILSFVKMTFATDHTVVTSLAPDTGQPISFVDHEGAAATTGDLRARIDTSASVDTDEAYGGQGLKALTGPGFKFSRGWFAEGVISLSPRVVLNGSHQRYKTPGNATTPVVHQGLVDIDIDVTPGDREISPEVARLGDAIDREYFGITNIELPESRNSGVRMRLNVPYSGLPTSPRMKIRALLFGHLAGPWCALTLSYYRVAHPATNTPTALSIGDIPLIFDVVTPSDNYDGVGGNLPPVNAIAVDSALFTIAAGDTIFVDLKRAAAASPVYTAGIGIIRLVGIISAGV